MPFSIFRPSSLVLTPIILVAILPLVCFALLTTWIAFATLYIRALIVYVELAVILLRNYMSSKPEGRVKTKFTVSPVGTSTPKKRRKSQGSARSSQSDLSIYGHGDVPRSPFPYVSLGYQRDFESVGGYNFMDDEEDDGQWIQLNSSLELPTPIPGQTRGKHVRANTAHGLPTLSGARSPRHTRLSRGGSSASLQAQPITLSTTGPQQMNDSSYFPPVANSKQIYGSKAAASSTSTTPSSGSSHNTVLAMKKSIP
jgi:hypothetical protein